MAIKNTILGGTNLSTGAFAVSADWNDTFDAAVSSGPPVGAVLAWNKTFLIKDSGTTTGTTANKLVDSAQNFLTTITAGQIVYNTTDSTFTYVTAVDSDTTLSVAADIMVSGEAYTIYATPYLGSRWLECNGQTVSDADSPYNGAILPDLNGSTDTVNMVGTNTAGAADFTSPNNPFTNAGSATYSSSTAVDREIGRTFQRQYIESVRITASISSYTSTSFKLQKYKSGSWTDVGSAYTSNQTDLIVSIMDEIEGLRIYFTLSTALARTCTLGRFQFEMNNIPRILRGASTSGSGGGALNHFFQWASGVSTNAKPSTTMAGDTIETIDSWGSDGVTTTTLNNASTAWTNSKAIAMPYINMVWIMKIK